MFKGLDPKINIPHRKTNFSEKHTSIDISFETVLFGFIDSSWGDLTLEQCCILSLLADSLMPRRVECSAQRIFKVVNKDSKSG